MPDDAQESPHHDKEDQDHSIFSLIHEIHTTITKSIDTNLSWDQLNSPPVNYTVIRPIVGWLNPSPSLSEPGTGIGTGTGKGRGKRGGMLNVPTSLGASEEDGYGRGRQKTKSQSGGSVIGTGTGTRLDGESKWGLGMVLYALMANR